jgi:hypothetical protein
MVTTDTLATTTVTPLGADTGTEPKTGGEGEVGKETGTEGAGAGEEVEEGKVEEGKVEETETPKVSGSKKKAAKAKAPKAAKPKAPKADKGKKAKGGKKAKAPKATKETKEKPSTGQSGPPLELKIEELNSKELKLFHWIDPQGEGVRPEMTIKELAKAFKNTAETVAQANSWARNCLRRLVTGKFVEKLQRGVYRVSEPGRKRANRAEARAEAEAAVEA